MMTELMLVEGVSDVQLISYYLQNAYEWEYRENNALGITPLDEFEHIESLSKGEDQLVLCGVGGNGKFAHFVEVHRINEAIVENEINTVMVVADRDIEQDARIVRRINNIFKNVRFSKGEWVANKVTDSFGQKKNVATYLLAIPEEKQGALEQVIIDALKDIPEERPLVQEVIKFIDSLKPVLVPELNKLNKSNKATVGSFFSVRDPQNAMRSFYVHISKIDWGGSKSLSKLFLPFQYFGKEKPVNS